MNLQFSPELVRMLGWTLLHFVWQGAAVAALLSITMAFVRSASLRYSAAVLALLVMLALPIGTFFVLREPTPQPDTFAATTQDTPPAQVVSTLGPVTGHHAPAAPADSPAKTDTMLWLVRLWMAGVLLFSIRSAGGWILVQRLRRSASVPATGDLLDLCLSVQTRMKVRRAVRFCRSAVLHVPAVVGGLRPIVLLPVSALTGLSDMQIEAIVAHELAHVRRFDHLVNLFQVFAETVLFYHPAVWWVNRVIRAERENCCDDTAIAVCGDRVAYVRALTHLESLRVTPQFALGVDGSPLKARVRRLLGMSEEREPVRAGGSALGAVIVAGLVLAATTLATGAKVQAQKSDAPAPEPPQISGDLLAAPESPALPQAATPALSAEPAPLPQTPTTPEKPSAAVEPRVEVRVPAVNIAPIDIPAKNIHVAAVNVDTPGVHIANPQVTVNVPPVHVHVPETNVHIPAIHVPAIHIPAMLAQANSGVQPSESYIEGMKAAGYSDLDVDELVAMKVQGVTPEYVKQMHEAGLKMDADELIALKIQGVTPEYVKQMRAAYPNIDTDTIIGMKIQGVTPEYAAGLSRLGIKGDADDIVGMKIQGVTPEYVRDMQATGLHFDTDELIGMKVQGVTPAYVAALKSAGFEKLDADDIIAAKSVGITPEFIQKARSHGFKDLDLDKLMELRNAGVL